LTTKSTMDQRQCMTLQPQSWSCATSLCGIYALGHIKIYWFARSPNGFKSSLDYESWNT
jgi:hypothetical protein